MNLSEQVLNQIPSNSDIVAEAANLSNGMYGWICGVPANKHDDGTIEVEGNLYFLPSETSLLINQVKDQAFIRAVKALALAL